MKTIELKELWIVERHTNDHKVTKIEGFIAKTTFHEEIFYFNEKEELEHRSIDDTFGCITILNNEEEVKALIHKELTSRIKFLQSNKALDGWKNKIAEDLKTTKEALKKYKSEGIDYINLKTLL